MSRRCFFLLCGWFLCFTCVRAVTVRIPATAMVHGPQVLLGEIATLEGTDEEKRQLAGLILDASPLLGKSRTLYLLTIRVRLRQSGCSPESITLECPASVTITRSSQTVHGQALVDFASHWLRQQAAADGTDEGEFVPLSMPGDIILPDGDLVWDCTPTGANSGRIRHVMLTVTADKYVWHGAVSFSTQRFAEVLVAGCDIPRGATLTPAMLTTKREDLSAIDGTPLHDIAALGESVAATTIAKGTILTTRFVKMCPTIKRNDRVEASARCGEIAIALTAVACEDGMVGETIHVRALQTGNEYTACILGPGEVEIIL